jgi:tetraacyldisaccharide 4'-kinase
MAEVGRLQRGLLRRWYGGRAPITLRPLAWIFGQIVKVRRGAYRRGWLASAAVSVPVVIVGNIVVGGAGKTPLVLWLALQLRQRGVQVGILTRGFGGSHRKPTVVSGTGDPALFGDEAVLAAQRGDAMVCSAADRLAGARLLEQQGCELILSDDGLQHYRLQRDLELAVVDAARGFGNGWLLPAGPLREPVARLASVDCIVCNGLGARPNLPPTVNVLTMHLVPGKIMPLTETDAGIAAPRAGTVHAVAGIADPQRFFSMLRSLGFAPIEHAFPDHHAFTAGDLSFSDSLPILMTEKDAVKCRHFDSQGMWYLPVEVEFQADDGNALVQRLLDCKATKRNKGT